MSIRERIAKAISPESVSLTTDYVSRLRAAHDSRKLYVGFLERENKRLIRKVAAKQAQIDRMMLEYCPDEMTPEQLEEWGNHQVPAAKEPA